MMFEYDVIPIWMMPLGSILIYYDLLSMYFECVMMCNAFAIFRIHASSRERPTRNRELLAVTSIGWFPRHCWRLIWRYGKFGGMWHGELGADPHRLGGAKHYQTLGKAQPNSILVFIHQRLLITISMDTSTILNRESLIIINSVLPLSIINHWQTLTNN